MKNLMMVAIIIIAVFVVYHIFFKNRNAKDKKTAPSAPRNYGDGGKTGKASSAV